MIHTVGIIRLGTSANLVGATSIYRRAWLSNGGYSDNLLAHPEYLILGPEGLAEGRTYVAEEDGSLVGFATWAESAGAVELEDLFVDPGYMRRGIASALVNRITDVLRVRGVQRGPEACERHRRRRLTLSVGEAFGCCIYLIP